ncbi:MAG: hypothetical protein MI861_25745 [Pirellulales bacterium]|nr:hypothetical protein [Pirellulales bacterium]
MPTQTTCWTLIDAAAAGDVDDRELFARRYEPLIRAYLGARWRSSPLAQEIGDACQDFFVDCFRDGGPLARVERGRAGGFRPFLYGIARIVALRWEEKNARLRARPTADEIDFGEIESDETELSQVFDRAWAKVVLQEAGQRHKERAEQAGPEAMKRVELLQLRFREAMPIRDIAKLWETDAAHLHRQYAKARDEFSQALHDVVSFHHPDASPADVQTECLELLTMLR